MLIYAFPFLLSISLLTQLSAQSETERLPTLIQRPVSLEDGQTVTNHALLAPTQELLPPYLATQALHGSDYFEWCLRWNKLQEYLAEERAIPPRILRGWTTSRQGYTEGTGGGYGFSSRLTRFRQSYNSTSDSREQQWQLGGYGGGPVMIYNPFVAN